MIELQIMGAARTVTGSKHLLRTSRATVLLECGLYQGHRRESNERNRSLPVNVGALDAMVLSHAHIDHSGALPLLHRKGYRGPVYATPATRDLLVPMLADAASIQESDAMHIQRLIERGRRDLEPVELMILRKPLGRERHKGSQLFELGDPGESCLESWLSGEVNAEDCATAAKEL